MSLCAESTMGQTASNGGCTTMPMANGTCTFAVGSAADAKGNNSVSIGGNSTAGTVSNGHGYAFGQYTKALASSSVSIGCKVTTDSTTTGNLVIGTSGGASNFRNTISHSIMLGTNLVGSTPTMYIENGAADSGNWGRIGIGTIYPDGLLHLKDESGDNTELYLEKYSDTDAMIRFYTGNTENGQVMMDHENEMRIKNKTNNKDMVFSIKDNNVQFNAITIDGSRSNVGIGTGSPDSRLDVLGLDNQGGNEILGQYATYDANNDTNYFRIQNESGTNGEFGTMLKAKNNTHDDRPVMMIKAVAAGNSTSTTTSILQFDSRYDGTGTNPRALFSWTENNNGATKMIMDAGGNVGIGTNTPSGKLDVNGSFYANLSMDATNPPNGPGNNVRILSSGELIEYTSSVNHKTNIEDVQFDKDAFLSLRPVDFTWKEAYGGGNDVGLIAEEVEEHMPNMVTYHYKHTYVDETTGEMLRDSVGIPVLDMTQQQAWGVDYRKISVYLLALVKDQDSLLSDMSDRLNTIEGLVENCCDSEPSFRIGEDPTDELLDTKTKISVFPNPNNGNFTVKYDLGNEKAADLYLITVEGEKIHLSKITSPLGSENFSISGSTGVYQVLLESYDGRVLHSSKIVVTR